MLLNILSINETQILYMLRESLDADDEGWELCNQMALCLIRDFPHCIFCVVQVTFETCGEEQPIYYDVEGSDHLTQDF